MDIVKNKVKNYTTLLAAVGEYVKKAEYSYSALYDILSKVRLILGTIKTSIANIKSARITSVEGCFQAMHHINGIEAGFAEIHELLIVDEDEQTEVSNTALLGVKSDFIKLEVKFSVLTSSALGTELVHRLSIVIRDESLDTINTLFEKYHHAIDLYAHYLQYALDNTDPNSRVYVKLLESLELAKNKALSPGDSDLGTGKYLQRFGLAALWRAKTKDQVLGIALYLIKSADEKRNPRRMYGGGLPEYGVDGLKKLSDIFREKRRGLYVMARISSNPVTFDLDPLIRRKVADTLKTSPGTGVTANVIKKFDNIKRMGQKFKPIFKDFKLGDTDARQWLVIRTLDGELFDILGFDMENAFVNSMYIDKMERGPSPLINNYQGLSNSILAKHIRETREVELSEITPLHSVSAKVSHAIMDHVDKELKTPPTNMNDLYEIVSGDAIEEITSSIIIKSYEEFAGKDSAELSSTFLFNADYIITLFTKGIREDFAKSKINEFMFKEKTENALIIFIRTTLIKIIKNAAERSFDPQKDIYEKLLVKKILLNTDE